ncbi:MAG: hypothetical protein OXI02_01835 [Candidatus Dadabacteria bacterium]|nr:hypothetical protein [Candidatus Dadabacteria bacterium]MDE0476792.1 hypothetical protein [Candidatus Dadabacteria bacterium]
MEISEEFFSFVSALLVLYVGNHLLDEERRNRRIRALYQALYEELKEIRNAYNEEVGVFWKALEEEGEVKVFPVNLSLTQDYLAVYHSNANLIGEIPSSKLRRKIVKTYTSLKVLIDYYKQNNGLLDQLEKEKKELVNQPVLEALIDYYKQDNKILYEHEKRESTKKTVEYDPTVLDFTKRLQERHHRFERSLKKLIKTLKKELSKFNYENPVRTISILRSSSLTTLQLL